MNYWTYHPALLSLTGGPFEGDAPPDVPVTMATPPDYLPGFYRFFDGTFWHQRPVPVIQPVAGRIALRRAGLMPAVQAAIAEAGGEAADWFEYALTWERLHPVVLQMSAALGLADEQLDQLFVQADLITRQAEA